jgi:hypothetical protein
MGRDKLERALERAAERIALGEKRIAHQREIIAELERAGRDADKAKGLLVVYEGTQEINFTVRDILRRQQKQALKEHSTKKPKRPKKPAKPAKN